MQNRARMLPVIKVGEKRYFMEERLKQYRTVIPRSQIVEIEFIAFGEEPWEQVDWICFHENEKDGICTDCDVQEYITK
jgi:hypothetical protein